MSAENNNSKPATFKKVAASAHANRTLQPLNELTDKMKPSSSTKPNLRLSVGDPTVDGNLPIPSMVTDALIDVIKKGEHNGYPPTVGYEETRKTIAQYARRFAQTKERKEAIQWRHVIVASGVSHGIQITLAALCSEGDNILVCAPSFPHYETVCDSYGIECRYYPLDSDNHWQCDLEHAAALVSERTRAMVMINPSNPCGSNYSRQHVSDVIAFCEHHQLVLFSDEIYAEMVFNNGVFTSVLDFDTPVPRLVLGGTAKYQVCPGWRLGWTILVDTAHACEEWEIGIERLAQLICGPNSLCQAAVANSLLKIPASHSQLIIKQLEVGARCYDRLLERKELGFTFDKPAASMFVMVEVNLDLYKDIDSGMDFYEKLLDEENVQVLPGEIFGVACPPSKYTGGGAFKPEEAEKHRRHFIRATISRPPEILNEAIDRLISFSERHLK